MKLSILAIPAALALLAHASAGAAERCYPFDKLAADAQWAPGDTVPMSIGEVRVRNLPVDGDPVATNPANVFLKVMATQKIAGGTAPEVYGKNVAVQMKPRKAVDKVSMKVAHQPGAGDGRAAFVEVNGERHEFNGSLAQLHGKTVGVAKLKVDLPTTAGNWVGGRLSATSKQGIESFTIGAGELRLDDVCFEK